MEQRDNDNRSYEEIRAGWEKNGLVFGKLMSKSEQREAQKKISEDARKRESKRTKKEMRRNISKPVALVSLIISFRYQSASMSLKNRKISPGVLPPFCQDLQNV